MTESHTYVLDTGIEGNHTELANSISNESWSFYEDEGCENRTDATCDANGHGTHVAGTIRSATAGYSL